MSDFDVRGFITAQGPLGNALRGLDFSVNTDVKNELSREAYIKKIELPEKIMMPNGRHIDRVTVYMSSWVSKADAAKRYFRLRLRFGWINPYDRKPKTFKSRHYRWARHYTEQDESAALQETVDKIESLFSYLNSGRIKTSGSLQRGLHFRGFERVRA